MRVIEEILNVTWKDAEAKGREVPEAREEDEDCEATECYSWDFGDYPKPPSKKAEDLGNATTPRCGW